MTHARAGRLFARVRSAAEITGYRLAWRGLRALPEPFAYAAFDAVADRVAAGNSGGVTRLRANYARIRPDLDAAQLDAVVREGVRRYLRYFCEAFRLPSLSRGDLDDRVRVEHDAPIRQALAAGQPVVCFLGHLGNWDLAGAWAPAHLGPVVTVAERLEPEEVFQEFLAFRERLGMTIIPASGAGEVYPELRRHLIGPVIAPLLADRDLTARGVDVELCGHPARVAAGPAALAVDTGAPLHAVSIRHERVRTRQGHQTWGIVVTFHPRVVDPGPGGDRRGRIEAMTQAAVDDLGRAIRAHPADWHMMQRVFHADLDLDRLPETT